MCAHRVYVCAFVCMCVHRVCVLACMCVHRVCMCLCLCEYVFTGYVCMCVCLLACVFTECVYMWLHACVCTPVYICMWSPMLEAICHPPSLFPMIPKSVSWSSPDCTSNASLTNQLVPEILRTWNYRWAAISISTFVVSGDPNSGLPTLTSKTSSLAPLSVSLPLSWKAQDGEMRGS